MLVARLTKLCRSAGRSHSSERSFRIRPFSSITELLWVDKSESAVTSESVNVTRVCNRVSKVIKQLLTFWFYYGRIMGELYNWQVVSLVLVLQHSIENHSTNLLLRTMVSTRASRYITRKRKQPLTFSWYPWLPLALSFVTSRSRRQVKWIKFHFSPSGFYLFPPCNQYTCSVWCDPRPDQQ